MNRIVAAFAIGLIFGVGIIVAGMADPAKVLNFFDIAGTWDPSLALVMASALLVTAVGYRLVFRAGRPLLADGFVLPDGAPVTLRLIGGAATFGVGWGIAGFCPGGVIPALGLGRLEPLAFVAALVAGMLIAKAIESVRSRAALARTTGRPEQATP